jgi:hypothetical protein
MWSKNSRIQDISTGKRFMLYGGEEIEDRVERTGGKGEKWSES